MPHLAGNVDLTENPNVDLQLSTQIGSTIGQAFGIRAAEKRKQELDAELVASLQEAVSKKLSPQETLGLLKTRNKKLLQTKQAQYLQELALKQQFGEPEYDTFSLGGQGGTAEKRYRILKNAPLGTQAESIATGPTPQPKPQAGKGMVYQNDAGEYRYGIVSPYTGELIKDLRHATEQDLQQAKIEGQQATTEKTRSYTDILRQKLEGMPDEQAQTILENEKLRLDNELKVETAPDRKILLQSQIDATNALAEQRRTPKSTKTDWNLFNKEIADLKDDADDAFTDLMRAKSAFRPDPVEIAAAQKKYDAFRAAKRKKIKEKADALQQQQAEPAPSIATPAPQAGKGTQITPGDQAEESRRQVILDLASQGVTDLDEIYEYANYDDKGNLVGDFSKEEIEKYLPSKRGVPLNLVAVAENLTGLKLKKPLSAVDLDLGGIQGDRQHLGRHHGDTMVLNSNFKQGLAGETPESNTIHEVMHAILEQNEIDTQNTSEEEIENAVKDAEFWYLAGNSGVSPKMKQLLERKQNNRRTNEESQIPKRKPGESIADYLKRTKQK